MAALLNLNDAQLVSTSDEYVAADERSDAQRVEALDSLIDLLQSGPESTYAPTVAAQALDILAAGGDAPLADELLERAVEVEVAGRWVPVSDGGRPAIDDAFVPTPGKWRPREARDASLEGSAGARVRLTREGAPYKALTISGAEDIAVVDLIDDDGGVAKAADALQPTVRDVLARLPAGADLRDVERALNAVGRSLSRLGQDSEECRRLLSALAEWTPPEGRDAATAPISLPRSPSATVAELLDRLPPSRESIKHRTRWFYGAGVRLQAATPGKVPGALVAVDVDEPYIDAGDMLTEEGAADAAEADKAEAMRSVRAARVALTAVAQAAGLAAPINDDDAARLAAAVPVDAAEVDGKVEMLKARGISEAVAHKAARDAAAAAALQDHSNLRAWAQVVRAVVGGHVAHTLRAGRPAVVSVSPKLADSFSVARVDSPVGPSVTRYVCAATAGVIGCDPRALEAAVAEARVSADDETARRYERLVKSWKTSGSAAAAWQGYKPDRSDAASAVTLDLDGASSDSVPLAPPGPPLRTRDPLPFGAAGAGSSYRERSLQISFAPGVAREALTAPQRSSEPDRPPTAADGKAFAVAVKALPADSELRSALAGGDGAAAGGPISAASSFVTLLRAKDADVAERLSLWRGQSALVDFMRRLKRVKEAASEAAVSELRAPASADGRGGLATFVAALAALAQDQSAVSAFAAYCELHSRVPDEAAIRESVQAARLATNEVRQRAARALQDSLKASGFSSNDAYELYQDMRAMGLVAEVPCADGAAEEDGYQVEEGASDGED